jgi:excisionase family DNA binding protein
MTTLTTEQAAERLGITPSRVRVLIRAGRLPAQRFGRAHIINESDLKMVADRKVGRPLGSATTKAPAQTTAKLNRAFREATEADQEASKKATKRGKK